IEIQLDFGHDDATHGFYASHPKAKSAVEKAAKDLSKAISASLQQISGDLYSGTNGGTEARFDWGWSYVNPVTGATEQISSPSVGNDTVIVYVGTRNISSGSTLGQGGIGGASVLISAGGFPQPTEWIDAVTAAELSSNTAMTRGGGPVVNTISGSANFAGYNGVYDLDYGLSVGNLWLDIDTDNNGSSDSAAALDNFWHYDSETAVAAGKMDFYTVALHELLHVLGAGTTQTWDQLSNSTQWLGAEASGIAGTSYILDSDGHHIAPGVLSARLSDGVFQESILSPGVTPGVRKELTELDLAILEDLGYNVSYTPVPEPSSAALFVIGLLAATTRRSRSH
ncbi:MAG: PEP-CTERM sorting domain-containing protein, partial [Akkermansiaceae bacterium]